MKEIDCPSCGGYWFNDLDESGVPYTCFRCCNGTQKCYEEDMPMNERIRELAEQAGAVFEKTNGLNDCPQDSLVGDEVEKFAELIVQECIKQAHSVGDLRGANEDMIYGADTAAVQISKHFGVEE